MMVQEVDLYFLEVTPVVGNRCAIAKHCAQVRRNGSLNLKRREHNNVFGENDGASLDTLLCTLVLALRY